MEQWQKEGKRAVRVGATGWSGPASPPMKQRFNTSVTLPLSLSKEVQTSSDPCWSSGSSRSISDQGATSLQYHDKSQLHPSLLMAALMVLNAAVLPKAPKVPRSLKNNIYGPARNSLIYSIENIVPCCLGRPSDAMVPVAQATQWSQSPKRRSGPCRLTIGQLNPSSSKVIRKDIECY